MEGKPVRSRSYSCKTAELESRAKVLAHADTRELLPTVGVPTLLIWGDADKRAPLGVGQAIRDAIPGARLEIVPGVGHLSNLERPTEFNQLVRDFCLPRSSP